MSWRVIEGDCLEVMAGMGPESIDAVVTDPPYGLGFMGKQWDARPPGVEWAEECLRVLKPGGHLLAFGGTRTYHRLACAIEDAGFEIRDCLAWLYAQGFPKSRNISGEFKGWGTALKPAHESIVMARKPLVGAVASNMAEYGTGALNVDGCRIEASEPILSHGGAGNVATYSEWDRQYEKGSGREYREGGRWPANVALDEDTAGAFKESRFFYCAKASRRERGEGNWHPTVKPLALMRWLVRMVTPPAGTVLDPFAGSGTTGCACVLENFGFIGVEREAEYVELARVRIAESAAAPSQLDLEAA